MAEVKRYAIVRDGLVENVTLWDGVAEWSPPEGTQAIECHDRVSLGWTYDGTDWLPPGQ